MIKRRRKKINLFFLILTIIMLIFSAINTYLIIGYNIIPIKYLIIYIFLFIIIPFGINYLLIFRRRLRRKWRILGSIYDILYILVMILILFYLSHTFKFLDNFTSNYNYEIRNYYILVDESKGYKNVKDLESKVLGYSENLDKDVLKAIKQFEEKVDIHQEAHIGVTELFTHLKEGSLDCVILLDTFYDMLKEGEDALVSSTKIIYEFSIKVKSEIKSKEVDVKTENFNVYISGIDTFGAVSEQARSDVNIVMSINPKTHQILMISIPRDYYVYIPSVNGKDKLTHAGMFGVNASVKTIENLLDLDINYYIKVNFNALIRMIDALGGVDVYSEHDFYSTELTHHFIKGYNHVDGELALDFVRTRKAFKDGDRVRGENQQAMIQAVINKATSAEILLKYDDILKSLEDCFATNMSMDSIMDLVNMQLDEMPKWNIQSISLNGSDAHDFTYSYPHQQLYVMLPNEETVDNAKSLLKKLDKDDVISKEDINIIMNQNN